MAYIFQEDKLPKLVSVVPGRERTFFVNKELTHIDDMLAGVMHYVREARRLITCTKIASIFISSWKDKVPWNRKRESARWAPAT
jgi:hypothetical protein